jgi:hypothetical protein
LVTITRSCVHIAKRQDTYSYAQSNGRRAFRGVKRLVHSSLAGFHYSQWAYQGRKRLVSVGVTTVTCVGTHNEVRPLG